MKFNKLKMTPQQEHKKCECWSVTIPTAKLSNYLLHHGKTEDTNSIQHLISLTQLSFGPLRIFLTHGVSSTGMGQRKRWVELEILKSSKNTSLTSLFVVSMMR